MPVSVVGVNISKTGNYTILITVSIKSQRHIFHHCNSNKNTSILMHFKNIVT
ncbi:TPA: hypothetical protein HIB58_002348 [Escherichia coli]|nr:hypothetical protein [Escherichia coli]HAH6860335.1 hypothetical protein [Escherichia coli]HAH7431879.1 hypothetical protein [Escherichia coli]